MWLHFNKKFINAVFNDICYCLVLKKPISNYRPKIFNTWCQIDVLNSKLCLILIGNFFPGGRENGLLHLTVFGEQNLGRNQTGKIKHFQIVLHRNLKFQLYFVVILYSTGKCISEIYSQFTCKLFKGSIFCTGPVTPRGTET